MMKKLKISICVALIMSGMSSCVTTQGFLRGELEGSEAGRIRSDYKIGEMKTCTYDATMGSLLFGIIRLNEQDARSMYNKCIEKTSKELGTPIIGFYESRGEFKTTKIPGILTGGLIGLRFYKISITGQPYLSKGDNELK